MTPEEEERRRLRRERNKLAAARCRQRRVDLTNQLLAETECLEDEKLKLEKEITNLQRQRTQLEFVLEAHSSRCCHVINTNSIANNNQMFDNIPIKVEAPDDNPGFPSATGGSLTFDRPSSLALRLSGAAPTNGCSDICVGGNSTPMCFNSLGLDCMIDGHTGLTPITGTPSCRPTGSADQQDQRHVACDVTPGGGQLSPTTLMTL
jgi:hypothetical protein